MEEGILLSIALGQEQKIMESPEDGVPPAAGSCGLAPASRSDDQLSLEDLPRHEAACPPEPHYPPTKTKQRQAQSVFWN
ncbi:hypothetical protein P7K49_001546 [Saguinus oedipus]|uniref:Uncharacterized protein n=1 Tax=Saguinus oedipus TaxID=9490 RepID=A0ABQ9WF85_SAGOE|nr:hypothetical protein P7K49_001546 [Saguinus oedipus]